ncbi:unnamed protein product, partial [Laminaria digitata]
MDKVGVGESQTHVHLWWDARARATIKKVRDNGGKLFKDDLDPTMLARIQQGKVNGLAYDYRAERVYHTAAAHAHMPQPRNPAPPPPFAGSQNMAQRRHANVPQSMLDAHAGMGGARRVDPGGHPYHAGNPPMAGNTGGIPPRAY